MTDTDDLVIYSDMQKQAAKDVANRSHTGIIIYLIIWFAIIIPAKLHITAPKECLALTILFICLALGRFTLVKNFDLIYSKSPLAWKVSFYPFIIISALAWGIFCAASLVSPIFHSVSLLAMITTAGLAGGGSTSLAPDRSLTLALITSFLFPTGITALFFSYELHTSIGFMFVVYWLGMYFITKAQHNEYWLNLRSSFLIKEYAAELKQLSTVDALTGLKNRRYFDDALGKAIKNSTREKSPLALFIIDIDHFKTVNDSYGHLTGDEYLRRLARLLSKVVKRETDTVARFGGEEFAIILPGINAKDAITIAEKIRKETEKMQYFCPNGEVHFTVSVGISCKTHSQTISELDLIEAADKALYQAKTSGRNQVKLGRTE